MALLEEAKELSEEYRRSEAEAPAAESASIFKELGCLDEYGEALFTLARSRYYAGAYTAASEVLLESIAAFVSTGNIPSETRNRRFLGAIYGRLSEFDDALTQHTIAVELATRVGNQLQLGATHNSIALIQRKLGNYELAMEHAVSAERILSDLDRSDVKSATFLSESYLMIANLQLESMNFATAMEYCNRALDVQSPLKQSEVLNVIGHCHEGLGEYERAIELFRRSYVSARQCEQKWSMTAAIANIGRMYRRLEQHDRAVRYLQKGLKRMSDFGDRNTETIVLVEMSYSLLELGQTDAAHQALCRAHATAIELELLPAQKMVHQAFRDHFAKIGDYRSALEHYTRFHELREQLLSVEQKETLDRREMEFKMELKLKEEEIRQRNNVLEAVIAAQESERERIARDLHDGVGQMLAAARMSLAMYTENLAPPKQAGQAGVAATASPLLRATAILESTIDDVRTISHALGSSTLREMGLAAALDELIGNMQANGRTRFEVLTTGLPDRLGEPVESGLFRIVQELVTNIARHASAADATVQIIHDGREILLTVEDNGLGFDIDTINGRGMGRRNVEARVTALGGQLHYDSTPGHGTTVSVCLPAQPPHARPSTGFP